MGTFFNLGNVPIWVLYQPKSTHGYPKVGKVPIESTHGCLPWVLFMGTLPTHGYFLWVLFHGYNAKSLVKYPFSMGILPTSSHNTHDGYFRARLVMYPRKVPIAHFRRFGALDSVKHHFQHIFTQTTVILTQSSIMCCTWCFSDLTGASCSWCGLRNSSKSERNQLLSKS